MRVLRGSPGEINKYTARLAIDIDAHLDRLSAVQFVTETTWPQPVDRLFDTGCGVVLNVSHVGAHRVETVALHRTLDHRDTACIGGELGTKVRDVLIGVARRVASSGELISSQVLVELIGRDE